MIRERLNALRSKMADQHIDAYFINTSDYHMSEYIPEYFKTLRYFSGFTGSLGQLIVTKDDAFLFVDGRYHGQASQETEQYGIKVQKLGVKGVLSAGDFLIENCKDSVIGFDGRCVNYAFTKKLINHGLKLKSVDLYSDIFEGRKPLGQDPLYKLDVKYAGLSRKEKLDIIKRSLDGKTHIIQNLESIAYLLNLRANDIAYTPVFLSYMVFDQDEAYLFINQERLSDDILMELYEDGVIIKPYEAYYDFIKTLKKRVILLDEAKVNYDAYTSLDDSNKIYHMRSIVEDMKTVKNPVEIENFKMAHIYDGVAMVRFLKWLKEADKETLNEYDVKETLNKIRLGYRAFDLSFETIVGYNANAAMMHYTPTKDRHAQLHNEGILLVDSGGHYLEGTTDITRTIALGPVSEKVKKYFTLVLKSMYNLSEVKFLDGMCGNQLDILARKDLWELGVDYRCGTGHGVGYALSVHECPPNVRYSRDREGADVAIKPGNIFSDEPGVYFEGEFGIRCENLVLCKRAFENEYGTFNELETITVVPFDLDLIDKRYLDQKTIDALNTYHERVYQTLCPYLNEEECAFLREATRRI